MAQICCRDVNVLENLSQDHRRDEYWRCLTYTKRASKKDSDRLFNTAWCKRAKDNSLTQKEDEKKLYGRNCLSWGAHSLFFLCHAYGKHIKVKFFDFITLVRFVCLCPGGREFKFLFRALFHQVRPDELNISTDWQQHRRYTKGNDNQRPSTTMNEPWTPNITPGMAGDTCSGKGEIRIGT